LLKLFSHLIWICVGLFFFPSDEKKEIKAIHLSGHAQGTTWNITYYDDDTLVSNKDVDSIFNSIDSSLSIYKPYSLITKFNNSTRGVKTDYHLQHVVKLSLKISKETKGLSDITVAPLVEAWGFGVKESLNVPDQQKIRKILSCVGYKRIILTSDSVIKSKPCVKIDVNGIAQGYTVDVLADYLKQKGIKNFLVELGGELRAEGRKQPGDKPFKIGIESPSGDDFSTAPMQKIVVIDSGAITTSGNYRKFHESRGKKYSHIIDPRTGKSVDNEMISVTVFAKDAITADAYDNALMLMGVERALRYIEQRPGMAAFIIYRNQLGVVTDTATSRFRQLIQSN
jgi:FAD:protein FMN transferase